MPYLVSYLCKRLYNSLHASGKLLNHVLRPGIISSDWLCSLDPATSKEEICDRVKRVVSELGLTDVRHNRIGNAVQRGISGGQKRRVTIGSSLVTMPRILFLDEPTSGLDSRTSREVLAASQA